MTDLSDHLTAALTDRNRMEREIPALKGGLGAMRRVLKDAVAAPSRGLSPGATRGGP